jgi:U4/U6.U5 tri-snRNP-associated protein 3
LDQKDQSKKKLQQQADMAKSQPIQVKAEELEGLSEEEQMQRMLGFSGFGSTKGEAVKDNQTSAARGAAAKNKARKYRQYMNRKGGFNRPLDKMP